MVTTTALTDMTLVPPRLRPDQPHHRGNVAVEEAEALPADLQELQRLGSSVAATIATTEVPLVPGPIGAAIPTVLDMATAITVHHPGQAHLGSSNHPHLPDQSTTEGITLTRRLVATETNHLACHLAWRLRQACRAATVMVHRLLHRLLESLLLLR